jgi:formate hydrogenlyase subunit 4
VITDSNLWFYNALPVFLFGISFALCAVSVYEGLRREREAE